MTFEERAKWVEENIEPTQFEPFPHNDIDCIQGSRNGEWLYTNLHQDTIFSLSGIPIGTLETRVRFLCDANFTRVLDTNTIVFRVIPYGGAIATTESFRSWFAPDNVRVIYTAWFATPVGTYLVEHWYNFHGHGAYSLRIVKS